MRRAVARVDELVVAGRVPLELQLAMWALAIHAYEHVAGCPSCRSALERALPGLPAADELCVELREAWRAIGVVGSLIVEPETAELGPFAKCVES
jgi:hypothetical protein